jgi:citrate synthase
LESLKQQRTSVEALLAAVRDGRRGLPGFARQPQTSDPRVELLRRAVDELFGASDEIDDPLYRTANELQDAVRGDPYFVERGLQPNADFYSALIYYGLGIPKSMFQMILALGRLPGWIAHVLESREADEAIHRPRQLYTGPGERLP